MWFWMLLLALVVVLLIMLGVRWARKMARADVVTPGAGPGANQGGLPPREKV